MILKGLFSVIKQVAELVEVNYDKIREAISILSLIDISKMKRIFNYLDIIEPVNKSLNEIISAIALYAKEFKDNEISLYFQSKCIPFYYQFSRLKLKTVTQGEDSTTQNRKVLVVVIVG